jgi:hypothetical protein
MMPSFIRWKSVSSDDNRRKCGPGMIGEKYFCTAVKKWENIPATDIAIGAEVFRIVRNGGGRYSKYD